MERRKVRNPPGPPPTNWFVRAWRGECLRCEAQIATGQRHCPVCGRWAGIMRDAGQGAVVGLCAFGGGGQIVGLVALICGLCDPTARSGLMVAWLAPCVGLAIGAVFFAIFALCGRYDYNTERFEEEAKRRDHG